jgi:hypothetical protein
MTDDPIGSPGSNDIVRQNLSKLGDDGSVARTITHFGRPGPDDPAFCEEVIEDFSLSLSTFGFVVEAEDVDGEDWVALSHVSPVTADALDTWTQWLAESLANVGWIYDGWDCDVLHPGDADAAEHKEMTT